MATTHRKPIRLNDQQKRFIVQRLACFDGPDEVASAVNEEFGLKVSKQAVHKYDPTKKAGEKVAQKWRDLFEETRKDFLKNVERYVPEANKMVRIRQLAHAARSFKGRGNYVGMADMMERIAKELGNVHTNRREISGRDGKPIEYTDMSEEQIDARLTQLFGEIGAVPDFLSADERDAKGRADAGSTKH